MQYHAMQWFLWAGCMFFFFGGPQASGALVADSGPYIVTQMCMWDETEPRFSIRP